MQAEITFIELVVQTDYVICYMITSLHKPVRLQTRLGEKKIH